MKFLDNINLTGNELQNAKLQNLAVAPTGAEGLVYYDTALKKYGLYANGAWKYGVMTDVLAAANGVATLDSSTLVVQNPASAATLSGAVAGKIPVSSTGGKLDGSYIPTLNNIPAPTAAVALNNQKITGLADPTLAQDAATKNYVDSAVQGLDVKSSVHVATTANITLSGTQTIDGIAVAVNDRVLVKNQTAPAENGIYIVASAAWSRALDTDSWNELISAFVFVEQGTTSADTGWTCSVDAGGTLGTTAVTWVQFSAAGQTTAANVGTGAGTVFRDKVGTTLNMKSLKAGSKILITNNADDITLEVNEANLVFANMTSSGTLPIAKGGTGATTATGSGAVVLATSPTLVTPALGVAAATSVNKVTVTPPTTSATLTLADGSTLATVGAFSTTFTATAATAVTLPTTGTLATTANAETLTNKTIGSGSTWSGNAVPVANGGTGGGTAAVAKSNLGFMTRYAADIGNGTLTVIPVAHGLNTLDVTITVYEKASGSQVMPDISLTDANTASLVFAVAPTASQYRVVVIG